MKKNPVKAVGAMIVILGIFTVAFPIINIFEKEKTPEWYFAIVVLMSSMTVIYSAFRHQQKRIDMLEEQMNNKSSDDSMS